MCKCGAQQIAKSTNVILKTYTKMNAKVRVCAEESTGAVIVRSQNNADYGHIRVEQTRMLIDDNGFARKRTLSALIPGTVEDLKMFGWTAGQEISGQVIVKESLEPFNTKNPERDYKMGGKTDVVCCVDGEPIYRKHFYTLSEGNEDISIAHDNGDAISAAYAVLKEEGAEAGSDITKL
jgi:hypothetical protein